MPGYSLKIPETTSFGSGPNVIYHLSCNSGSQHCAKAHYTGRASSSNPAKKAMAGRWANHKSHFNNNREFDLDPVARMESFRALKLSRSESFRVLKS